VARRAQERQAAPRRATFPRKARMPGADEVRGRRERDKLTIADVCADLGVSRVGGKLGREGLRTAAQADSFRSALLTAARKGEAFSLATGRPAAWERRKSETTWYEFACAYVDMKWKQASAKYRKDIARALTAATPAMLAEARGRPDDASIRRALVR
jgi:hypothetical protein